MSTPLRDPAVLDALLPCPFCGGDAVLDGRSEDVRVRCETGCGTQGAVAYFDADDFSDIDRAEAEARTLWNTRATPQGAQPEAVVTDAMVERAITHAMAQARREGFGLCSPKWDSSFPTRGMWRAALTGAITPERQP